MVIGLVLPQVVLEVGALVLDVELGLADRVEPNHQFSQARRACHQDDFIFRQAHSFSVCLGSE